jgi:hypothetical protein
MRRGPDPLVEGWLRAGQQYCHRGTLRVLPWKGFLAGITGDTVHSKWKGN